METNSTRAPSLRNVTVDSGTTGVVLAPLFPFAVYRVHVLAARGSQEGPKSENILIKTEDYGESIDNTYITIT